MSTKLLSSIGTITKKEPITSADHIDGVNIMIFETQQPYAGYYGTTVPDNPDTSSYFLVTRLQHNDDRIIRAIQGVKKKFKHKFDGDPGHLSFNNKFYGVIRIKCLPEAYYPELIEALSDQGIEFVAKHKQAPVDALIHLTKYFHTEELDEGIYIDLRNDSFAYLKINKHLDWDKFVEVTQHVRNNVGGISFDGAQSTLYDMNGIVDLVRVFDDKRSLEKLKIIRDRYLDSI